MAEVTRDVESLATLFLLSGAAHLGRPQLYEPLVPGPLRSHRREVIYASGVAELLCGAGLLVPRTRVAAGYASAALLVAIFPGNLQMTANQARRAARRRDLRSRSMLAATVLRLPAQFALIRAALRAAGRL